MSAQDLVGWLPAWMQIDVLARLLLASALGASVGIEREMRGKPAGLRTVILITVGAELFTEASLAAAGMELHELVRADPARIAAQVVSGIGFIGAGTILVHRGSVVGLTTAASLWVAAAIGMTVGLREYVIAVGGTVLVMLTLVVVGWLESRLLDRTTGVLRVTMAAREDARAWVEERLDALGFRVSPLERSRDDGMLSLAYRIAGDRDARARVLDELFEDPGVRDVRLE